MSDWVDLCGRVRIQRGRAPDEVADLFQGMLPPFASLNRQFFDRTADQAFAYGESQLHSMLLPALRDVAGVVFREQPVFRGQNRDEGRVDYWLEHRDVVVLVEIKHGYLSVRNAELTAQESVKWSGLQQQIGGLLETKRDMVPSNRPVAVVGMIVLVHWGTHDIRGAPETTEGACWERHQKVLTALRRDATFAVNWSAQWLVPSDMQCDEWSDPARTYPAVSFFAAARKRKPSSRE